jgi:hypothetical protein
VNRNGLKQKKLGGGRKENRGEQRRKKKKKGEGARNNRREILQKEGGRLGEAEERKGSDRGKKIYTREEEQPQLLPCFLSTATAHHLTAADTAISNRR